MFIQTEGIEPQARQLMDNMSTCTVNIAFQKDLLREIDEVAKKEYRSRSDFLREAAR